MCKSWVPVFILSLLWHVPPAKHYYRPYTTTHQWLSHSLTALASPRRLMHHMTLQKLVRNSLEEDSNEPKVLTSLQTPWPPNRSIDKSNKPNPRRPRCPTVRHQMICCQRSCFYDLTGQGWFGSMRQICTISHIKQLSFKSKIALRVTEKYVPRTVSFCSCSF